MASSIQVLLVVYVILQSVECVLKTVPGENRDSKFEIIVPHNASSGYLVTKLGCSDSNINIQTHGRNGGFYDSFVLTNSGMLLVRKDLSKEIGKSYTFTVSISKSCHSNIPTHSTYLIQILHAVNVCHFPQRFYTGFLPKHPLPGTKVKGIYNLSVLENRICKELKLDYKITGQFSEHFGLNPVSTSLHNYQMSLISELPKLEYDVLYFTIIVLNGQNVISHTNVELIMIDDNDYNHLYTESPRPLDKSAPVSEVSGYSLKDNYNNNNQIPDKFVHVFDQNKINPLGIDIPSFMPDLQEFSDVRRNYKRIKRQADEILRFPENKTGVFFTIPSLSVTGGDTFVILETDSIFEVNSRGEVSLKPPNRLDYETRRSYTVTVKVTASNGNEQTKIVNVLVTDVNDEIPVFTNRPMPMLAAVSGSVAPNVEVYQLSATDADANHIIRFYLKGTSEDFRVDEVSGRIITRRNLNNNQEYILQVIARDIAADGIQDSKTEQVSILTGPRPPQFYYDHYFGSAMENTRTDTSHRTFDLKGSDNMPVNAIQVKNFQSGQITFKILEPPVEIESNKLDITSTGSIVSKVSNVWDYETRKTFDFIISATDSKSLLTSKVNLTINILDVNEYVPQFLNATYKKTVSEDTAVDKTILEVQATDADADQILTYAVTNDHFRAETVGNTGYIVVNKKLDYDRLLTHRYTFKVTATDNGTVPLSGNAIVEIKLENVNDEPPIFDADATKVAIISENMPRDETVIIAKAVDIYEGDGVTHTFAERALTHDIFTIEGSTGKITLNTSPISQDKPDQYKLVIYAIDDGSCCGNRNLQTASTTVTINIVDEENTKPVFLNCNTIGKVREEEGKGTKVLQIQAADNNRGENGNVEYYLRTDQSQATSSNFTINKTDGWITTKVKIDREALNPTYTYVSIMAQDRGQPPANNYCTLKIEIEDINDNPPLIIGAPIIEGYFEDTAQPETLILRIQANDKDAGPDNNDIEYSLVDNPGDYMKLDLNTGEIRVKTTPPSATNEIILTVMAQDKGSPRLNSTAEVKLTKQTDTSGSPEWIGPMTFSVPESVGRPYVIATLKANPGVDGTFVDYNLLNSSLLPVSYVPPFTVEKPGDGISIVLKDYLDYETKTSHKVILRATNRENKKYTITTVTIEVQDTNDEYPRLTDVGVNGYIEGSVPENRNPGVEVRPMYAVDRDITSPFNKVSYYIQGNNTDFRINSLTGMITTNSQFDRETKKEYFVTVLVKDGAKSAYGDEPNESTETVRIEIEDENDNSPYFRHKIYNASVPEDKPRYFQIILVEAQDPDDDASLKYTLEQNGAPVSRPFDVKTNNGWIFVSYDLDFETEPNVYNLTVSVYDGKYTNSTSVVITVTDVNDEEPVFNQDLYVITNVSEADEYSEVNKLLLVQVLATDPDTNRKEPIEYYLDENSNNAAFINKFEIEKFSGKLYLKGQLDRDEPNGRDVYQFDVKAIDDGPASQNRLTAYATIKIYPIDVNDNSPIFNVETLTGYVKENSPTGTTVMTIVATDYDAGNNAKVSYQIREQNPSDAFAINLSTGTVTTTTSQIDREQISNFTFEVIATDGGVPPRATTATATVIIKDVNDNPVTITPDRYELSIPESHTQLVKVFEATDPDIDDTLFYEIISGGQNHFTMTSRGRKGELSVVNVNRPDYDAGDRFFSLSCEVDDGKEEHKATFLVNITILDVNDEIPEFTEKNVRISVREDTAPGTVIRTFKATDRDAGVNGEIEYFISHKEDSDPDYHFDIGIQSGDVTIRHALDRETKAQFELKILAIDKGVDIRNTGTATMTVEIDDVNDEFPKFRDNYKVEVQENTEPSANNPLVVIYATDPDTIPVDQKFGFNLECIDGICNKFSLVPDYSADGGKGTATLNMKVSFDYEEKQFYYLPIKMWDMRDQPGQGQTGTNTLTVSIKNINDNPLKGGGSQVIRVYNYKGMFKNLVIGRVNYDDPDGWDIDNNLVFTMSQVEPAISYFSVDSKTGDVKMLENVPSVLHAPFEVIVKDQRASFTSTVTVNITDLPEEAPFFSGSMRLADTTPEDFIVPGKGDLNQVEPGSYDKFRQKLAELLNDGNKVDNVQIISVLQSPDNDKDVDVRFSAHGSPYYKASQLEGIVTKNKNEFQNAAGIKISTVSINACLKENCEGGCFNELDVTGEANVINAPGASVVGVKTLLHGKCGCRLPSNTTDCTPDYCYNGGTCEKNYWGVLSCKCPDEKFDGPRCQQTRHGFDGRAGGYALYKTLEQCEDSVTSIEIITNQPDGLIYYNGPSAVPQSTDPTDFILLQLENGQPKLMVDHGSGMLVLTIPVTLNDGQWHQIDVWRQGKQVTMTIDHCKNVANVEGGVQDRTTCEARGFTPGENVFINVKSPLEMGGRYVASSYPPGATSSVFNGCVRNLRHNNEIYDLFTNGAFPGSIDGCPAEDDVCRRNSIDDVRCEPNGDCRITQLSPGNPPQHRYICVCDPGFRGDNCETNTTIKDFHTNSYMGWNLVNALGTNRDLEIQLNFRTRDNEGLLYHVSSSTSEEEFITVQINNYMLELSYNLGDGIHNLTMYGVNASDGYWHTAKVQRYGKQFIMTMDGGEGVHIVQTNGPMFGHQQLDVKQTQLYSGASLTFSHNTVEIINNDLTMSCFNDIRLQSKIWFPMTNMESAVNEMSKIAQQNNVQDSCIRNDCANSPCFDPFVCRPLWGMFDCVCKPHFIREGAGCIPKPYCNPNPCLHGTCTFNDKTSKGFNCSCLEGWEGDLCNMFKQTRQEDGVMAAGLIAMLIILPLILIILIIAFVFWMLRRKKDDNLIPDDEKEDYDIRENIVSYDDEGAGEEDNEGYDINRLRKPVNGPGDMGFADRPGYGVENEKPRKSGPPGSGIGDFIDDRLNNADDDPNAPPFDTLRDFDFEGGGSDAGSLSSLNTSSSGGDQDYDYLNDWGPKFAKLADMYNQYDDTE